MKKSLVVLIAALSFVYVASSQAQVTILADNPINITGKLSNKGTITTASLTNVPIAYVQYQEIDGPITNPPQGYIGVLSITNFINIDTSTNVVTNTSALLIEGPTVSSDGKFVSTFFGEGAIGTGSNIVIFVTGTSKESKSSNVTVSAKFSGIWYDGATTVSGTIASPKAK